MKLKTLPKALLICLLLTFGFTHAQDGTLDTSFDGDGIYMEDISATGTDIVYAMAEQADGKIVMAGYTIDNGNYNGLVMRMDADGSADLSFDADGKAVFDISLGGMDRFMDMAIQPDGKIVACGYFFNGNDNDIVVIRLLSDGSYDNSFGIGGKAKTDFSSGGDDRAYALTLQPDGRIVVAGRSFTQGSNNLLLARYTTDGNLDTSFDVFGSVMFDPSNGGEDGLNDVEIADDGKIVATGYTEWGQNNNNAIIVRLDSAGQPDLSFSGDGFFNADLTTGADEIGQAIKVLSGGSILVAGRSEKNGNIDAMLIKVKSNGILDNTFNSDGLATYDFAIGGDDQFRKLEIQPDGKIIAGGYMVHAVNNNDFLVARMDDNGDLDQSFGNSGWTNVDIGSQSSDFMRSMLLMSDNRIMVGGSTGGEVSAIRLTNTPPVSIFDPALTNDELIAWPQPFNNQLMITVPSTLEEEGSIEIYGIDGSLRFRSQVGTTEAGQDTDLSEAVESLSAGIYILKLRTAGRAWSAKIIKQ